MASTPGSKPVASRPGNNPMNSSGHAGGGHKVPPYSGSPGGAKPSPPPPTSGSGRPMGGGHVAPPTSGSGRPMGDHSTPPKDIPPSGINLNVQE